MPGKPKESAPKFGLLRQLQQKPAQEPPAEAAAVPLNDAEAVKQKAAKAADHQVSLATTDLEQESRKAVNLPSKISEQPTIQQRQQNGKAERQQSSKAANLSGDAGDSAAEVVKQQNSKAVEEDEGEVHFTNYLKGSVSRRLQVYVALQKAQKRRGGGERVSIKNVLNQALEEFLDRNGG